MTDEELKKYMDVINARSATGEVEAPDEDSIARSNAAKAQADQSVLDQQSAATDAKGGKLTAAGDVVTAGGAAAANPYVAGAGLALRTVGMVDDAKRKNEQAKIDAYNKKIMAQRSAIHNMFT